jgi:hypothetical protein
MARLRLLPFSFFDILDSCHMQPPALVVAFCACQNAEILNKSSSAKKIGVD